LQQDLEAMAEVPAERMAEVVALAVQLRSCHILEAAAAVA
jgi:hypothetical protein